MRVAALESREAHHVEQVADVRAATLASVESERDVVRDAQVREQRALLGDVPDVAPLGWGSMSGVVDDEGTETDRPPVGPVEPGEDPQQRRLPAPRRTEDRGQGAVGDVQIDAAQHGLAREALVEIGHGEARHDTTTAAGDGIRSNQRPSTTLGTAAMPTMTAA